MKPPQRDPCAAHNLWCATFPTPSQDGTRVYVVCACDRPRVVTPAQWQAEINRRAQAGAAGAAGTEEEGADV